MLTTHRERFILIIGLVLCVIGALVLSVLIRNVSLADSDLSQDINAAKNFLAGRSIYSNVNFHPPINALLFVPLSYLPYSIAIIIWSCLSSLFYFITILIVIIELQIQLSPRLRILIIGLAWMYYPFLGHIALGQLSLLLSLLVIGAWGLQRHHHEKIAGALLGVACLIKLFPGIFLLFLILRRRFKAALTMVTVIIVGWLSTILIIGPEDVLLYVTQMAKMDAETNAVFPLNLSITGVFGRLFSAGPWVQPIISNPRISIWLTFFFSLGLFILWIMQTWKMEKTIMGDDRAYAVTLLAMMLISPITWEHAFVMLVLPFGILALFYQRQANSFLRKTSILILILFSLPDAKIANALMAIYTPDPMTWYASLIFLTPTIGLILIWGLLTNYRLTSDLCKLTRPIC
jgi:hypothetical protein